MLAVAMVSVGHLVRVSQIFGRLYKCPYLYKSTWFIFQKYQKYIVLWHTDRDIELFCDFAGVGLKVSFGEVPLRESDFSDFLKWALDWYQFAGFSAIISNFKKSGIIFAQYRSPRD